MSLIYVLSTFSIRLIEVLKYFPFVISSPNLSRNKLFKRPNLSKKGFSNNLYKGNKIYREIEFNKISAAYFKS